jgi:hypothetical protein
MSTTHPEIERAERYGGQDRAFVAEEPVCRECLAASAEVTTECGHPTCKACAVTCEPCGSIWCPQCVYEHGGGYVCRECLSNAIEAAEAA